MNSMILMTHCIGLLVFAIWLIIRCVVTIVLYSSSSPTSLSSSSSSCSSSSSSSTWLSTFSNCVNSIYHISVVGMYRCLVSDRKEGDWNVKMTMMIMIMMRMMMRMRMMMTTMMIRVGKYKCMKSIQIERLMNRWLWDERRGNESVVCWAV